MSTSVLNALTSEEFAADVAFVSTIEALYRSLQRSRQVRDVRLALNHGVLSETTIRRFIASMMDDFKRDVRFPHDLPMAALAVALERRPGDFVDEFLTDLARLRLAEMSLCIRVARLCLRQRISLPRTKSKAFDLRASMTTRHRSPRVASTASPEITFRGSPSEWVRLRSAEVLPSG